MTDNADFPLRFEIGHLGAVARRHMPQRRDGRVAAVFARSFYVEAAGTMICVCGADLGLGPLNAVVDTPAGIDWNSSSSQASWSRLLLPASPRP